MKKPTMIATLLGGVALMICTGCGNSKKITEATNATEAAAESPSGTDNTSSVRAYAQISNTKSDTTGSGTAEFTQQPDGKIALSLTVNFPVKANQSVAVHLHEHGACGDGGKEAHGHWNPTKEPHGKWGEGAFHSGDIGNVQLDDKGTGSITLSSDRWSIGGDEKTNILNKAVIVHSGVDDYKTQPTGNAGSRIGCGVIMRK